MSSEAPKPSPSPQAPLMQYRREDEPTTGEWNIAAVENVLREREPVLEKSLKKGMSERLTVGLVGTVVAALGVGFAVYFKVIGEARAAGDAGSEIAKQKAEAVQGELTSYRKENDSRFERIEKQGNRNEEKLDALLQALRVPNPAPKPSSPDGGN